jgi:hypothetical protein
LCIFSFSVANSTPNALVSGTAICISVCLTSLTPHTFYSWEKWLNVSSTCPKYCDIHPSLLCCSSCRLVTLLKVTIHVSGCLILSFEFINFSFQLFLRFVPVMSTSFGARGGAVGWGTALQVGRSRVRFPMMSRIFHWHNPSGRTVSLGSTQPLTEWIPRIGSKWGSSADGDKCWLHDEVFGFHICGIFVVMVAHWFIFLVTPCLLMFFIWMLEWTDSALFHQCAETEKYAVRYKGSNVTRYGMWNRC